MTFGSVSEFMSQYNYDLPDTGFIPEAIVANVLAGLIGIGLIADVYIFPSDGLGAIPVEVGRWKAESGQASSLQQMRDPFEFCVWTLIAAFGY
jgi:hypothetical protein